MKESDLQKQIFDLCTVIAQQYDIFCFSIPNESLMTALRMFKVDAKTSAMLVNHFKKMGMVPGVPDFCFLYKEKTIFIELKKPKEYPTDKQLIIHQKIEEAGHQVYVIRSLDEFLNVLAFMGIN